MEFSDTKRLLKRISSNYPAFICDDFKMKEWHNELKNYDFDDVNQKLEEHMRSVEYGVYEPKLYFLTKYLRTTKEKETVVNYKICCSLCGEYVTDEDYMKHYERCSSIDFINRQSLKMKGEEIDKQKYYNMSDEEFTKFYDKLLRVVYNQTDDKGQKQAIEKYFKTL